jgi:hypothetical protein
MLIIGLCISRYHETTHEYHWQQRVFNIFNNIVRCTTCFNCASLNNAVALVQPIE